AFFVRPGKRAHVRQVARELGTVASAVGRELSKLEELGVLASEVVGRSRVYRVNEASETSRAARALFERTIGVEALLREALARVQGVDRALLYGSHVEGTERSDSDIDVLIVGRPSHTALSEALMPLEQRIGREVHTTTMALEEFEHRRRRPGFV